MVDAGKIGAGRNVGNREDGGAMRLGGILASGVELALQIQLHDFHVAHGHADVVVSQNLHESGKTHTEADHLRGETVPPMPHAA